MKTKELTPLMITFDSEGIMDTNYFESDYNEMGLVYMAIDRTKSMNLFIPESKTNIIEELKTGKYCVLTIKDPELHHNGHRKEVYEFLFEDNSRTPMVIQLGDEASALCPNKEWNRKLTKLYVWTADSFDAIEFDLYIRVGDFKLPYLERIDKKTFKKV